MNNIYFDYNEPTALVTWLQRRPSGTWRLLIGNAPDNAPDVLVMLAAGYGLAEWMVTKLQAGQLHVRTTAEALDLPVGVILRSDQ